MIQYKDRTGIISRQTKKGVDLFLLPCSRYPEAELVTCVDPQEITLCDIPPRWLELNGGLKGRIVGNDNPNLGEPVEEKHGDLTGLFEPDPVDENFGYDDPEEEDARG